MSLLPRRALAATACCALLAACTIGDPAPSSPNDATSPSYTSHAKADAVASNSEEKEGDAQRTCEPKTVTLAAAGDLLMHTPVSRAAQAHASGEDYNYVALMEELSPQLNAADLAICHIEGPMNPRNENLNVAYEMVFSFPKEIARDAKKLGYDGCDFASNHTLHRDEKGKVTTEMAYTPTFVEIPGHTIHTVTAESNPESFARTTGTVDALGGCGATLY